MARYIPPHPKKGSAEAKAWGAYMQSLRKKKVKKNPGAAWHETEAMSAAEQAARVTPGSRAASFYIGKRAAHTESAIESGARGMNPRKRKSGTTSKRYGSSFDYGRRYAKFLQAEQDIGAHAVDIERMVGGSVDIPPGDYLAMRTAGIEPNAREYWKGFNSLFIKKNPRRPHGTFRSCARQVKQSLKHYQRTGDPKKICGAALSRKNPKRQRQVPLEVKQYQEIYRIALKEVGDPVQAKKMVERWYQGKLQGEAIRARKNPIAIYNKPRVIYGRCLALYAQKTSGPYAGQRFKHTFKNPVLVIGNPDGSVLLKSTVGKKLWGA